MAPLFPLFFSLSASFSFHNLSRSQTISINDGSWHLLRFLKQNCYFCFAYSSVMMRLRHLFFGETSISFHDIDCSEVGKTSFCRNFGIYSVPQYILIKKGFPRVYLGPSETAESLVNSLKFFTNLSPSVHFRYQSINDQSEIEHLIRQNRCLALFACYGSVPKRVYRALDSMSEDANFDAVHIDLNKAIQSDTYRRLKYGQGLYVYFYTESAYFNISEATTPSIVESVLGFCRDTSEKLKEQFLGDGIHQSGGVSDDLDKFTQSMAHKTRDELIAAQNSLRRMISQMVQEQKLQQRLLVVQLMLEREKGSSAGEEENITEEV